MPPPPQYVEKFDFHSIAVKNPVLRFLGGLKLGLTVLAINTVVSTIGEFLPHDSGMSLKLVFHTWWYRSLLVIQGVNLILNTYLTYVDETYPQFLPLFRKNPDGYKPLKIKHKAVFKNSAAPDSKTALQALGDVLFRRNYKVFYDSEGLYAHRGLAARFGSTVTHLGLITIIGGALMESFLKIEGVVSLAEGDRADYMADQTDQTKRTPLGFEVEVRDFEFTEYPGTSVASKFKSTVTFRPPGGQPKHDFVRVNHDVVYGGWTFHQTSFVKLGPDDPFPPRYFLALTETAPEGKGEKIHRMEFNLPEGERVVIPLPGESDRFVAVEKAADGQSLIWTVLSREAVLARGVKPLFGDLRIKMLRFLPDYGEDPATGMPKNLSPEVKNPAALVEFSANGEVAFRGWVFRPESPFAGRSQSNPDDPVQFVLSNVETPAGEGEIEDRAVVTVELRHQGRPSGREFALRLGQSVQMTGSSSGDYSIPGPYSLQALQKIEAYVTQMSVSKNPGIPVVWLGAILASFGPVLAFFVSRRRVWAHVDWAKKTIQLGGESRYSREALEEELAEAAAEWSALDSVKIDPPVKMSVEPNDAVLSRYL